MEGRTTDKYRETFAFCFRRISLSTAPGHMPQRKSATRHLERFTSYAICVRDTASCWSRNWNFSHCI